jgi:hypothetical protein
MSGSDASGYPVLAVVLAPAGARPGAPLVVEVCGVGDQAHAAALAARLAETRWGAGSCGWGRPR